jgi:hypothetical protein
MTIQKALQKQNNCRGPRNSMDLQKYEHKADRHDFLNQLCIK